MKLAHLVVEQEIHVLQELAVREVEILIQEHQEQHPLLVGVILVVITHVLLHNMVLVVAAALVVPVDMVVDLAVDMVVLVSKFQQRLEIQKH
jgi:hypothetical protein